MQPNVPTGRRTALLRQIGLPAALLWIALAMSGCGSANDAPSKQSPKLITIKEGTLIHDELEKRAGITSWTGAQVAGPEWQAGQATSDSVRQAILASAAELSKIDYGALSLPEFVTYTKALNLTPGQFDGRNPRLESYGQDANKERWALYIWRGPETPQHPDRLLVHRWVQVYALCNLSTGRVSMLLATIAGEALE